jgi:hypothetical protein
MVIGCDQSLNNQPAPSARTLTPSCKGEGRPVPSNSTQPGFAPADPLSPLSAPQTRRPNGCHRN